jgi:hypothetical protein
MGLKEYQSFQRGEVLNQVNFSLKHYFKVG